MTPGWRYMINFLTFSSLKTGLIFFWALWLSIVFLTNLLEGLKALHILPESWKFASKNYQMIQQATEKYSAPNWLNILLFAGVVLWQLAAALLFWIELFAFPSQGVPAVEPAFALNTALWAGFMIADEIFKAYDNQSEHLSIFIASLATILVIVLVH